MRTYVQPQIQNVILNDDKEKLKEKQTDNDDKS